MYVLNYMKHSSGFPAESFFSRLHLNFQFPGIGCMAHINNSSEI